MSHADAEPYNASEHCEIHATLGLVVAFDSVSEAFAALHLPCWQTNNPGQEKQTRYLGLITSLKRVCSKNLYRDA